MWTAYGIAGYGITLYAIGIYAYHRLFNGMDQNLFPMFILGVVTLLLGILHNLVEIKKVLERK